MRTVASSLTRLFWLAPAIIVALAACGEDDATLQGGGSGGAGASTSTGGTSTGGAGGSGAPLVGWISGATCYVVPPISDQGILPDDTLPEGAIATEMALSACAGEYEPVSFVISASEGDLTALNVVPGDLAGPAGTIDGGLVDVRVVKVWWQEGQEIWDHEEDGQKQLVPELLLKDDGLIKVEGTENYARLGASDYVWISDPTDPPECANENWLSVPAAEFPIQDADTLQPLDIAAAAHLQFWVTVAVPADAPAGEYAGPLALSTAGGELGQLVLRLRVLPFALLEPAEEVALYYMGRLSSDEMISSREKTEDQYAAEIDDLLRHGVKNVTHSWPGALSTLLSQLDIRAARGMDISTLYLEDVTYGDDGAFLAAVGEKGVTRTLLYGVDEAQTYEEAIAAIDAVHARGFEAFAAVNQLAVAQPLAISLDLLIGTPQVVAADEGLIDAYHAANHRVFSYANPQVGNQQPERYRRNYGLYLWQGGYDGSMDWAYQGAYCRAWNDFDSPDYRDHMFSYPTVNGVVDTTQWEGFREGVDDLRYLATLQDAIAHPASGAESAVAEATAWLEALKNSDLADLDAVREQMIAHILALKGL